MGYKKWGKGIATLSLEEEVKTLEESKEYLEAQLANVNARLEKLKA